MDMNLIHQRGGYNATFADLKRVENTERGVARLSDEGIELIKNTFVLVCDMDYYDRANTGSFLSGLLTIGAVALQANAQEQERKGNTDAAVNSQLASSLAATGAVVASDIGGFAVNLNAYLFRLKWDKSTCDKIYNEYWIDEETSSSDASYRLNKYNQDNKSFELDYIGSYKARSGKTVFRSQNDMYAVIRNVCASTITKAMNVLSKQFPVFKPKSLLYCNSDNLYAYVGRKENINYKTKFDVLETEKTKKGFKFNSIAIIKPVYGKLWDNTNTNFADSTSSNAPLNGTVFTRIKGEKDLCNKGFVIREYGKAGYQYKRNCFSFDLIYGSFNFSDEDMEKGRTKTNYSWERIWYTDNKLKSTYFCGFDAGWTINYNTKFGWNVLNSQFLFGESGDASIAATTGIILRTRPMGKNGCMSFFIMPSFGIFYSNCNCTYTEHEWFDDGSGQNEDKEDSFDKSGFYYDLRAGLNITSRLYCAYSTTTISNTSFVIGYHF
jgi:hypothetical protein